MTIYNETLTDTVTASHDLTPLAFYGVQTTNAITSNDNLDAVRAHNPTLTEIITLTDGATALYGLLMAEAVLVRQTLLDNSISNIVILDHIALVDAMLRAYPAAISEVAAIAASETVQRAVTVLEELGIGELVLPSLIYNATLAESIQVAADIARFFGASISDGFTASDALLPAAFRAAQVAEGVTVTETQVPLFLLHVTAEESVNLDDIDVVKMLFNASLADGIEIVAGYLAPGDGITTWAMNTRTGSVTEYANYPFNSFARSGRKYIGASDSGLYELVGDDDDGADIIATIKSGLAQWAGTHLGAFKGAYLAVRGEGAFVLRIILGDDTTVNYDVTALSMQSSRIQMGKGLKSRYFSFELVSTGQDFDLDTLEFIPLVAQRRV